jgi:hypothetical protein
LPVTRWSHPPAALAPHLPPCNWAIMRRTIIPSKASRITNQIAHTHFLPSLRRLLRTTIICPSNRNNRDKFLPLILPNGGLREANSPARIINGIHPVPPILYHPFPRLLVMCARGHIPLHSKINNGRLSLRHTLTPITTFRKVFIAPSRPTTPTPLTQEGVKVLHLPLTLCRLPGAASVLDLPEISMVLEVGAPGIVPWVF